MKLYLYSPMYKKSKYIPHLLEHIIFPSINEEIYFDIADIDLSTFSNFILISNFKKNFFKKILRYIKEIPNEKLGKQEHNVLKKELEDINYGLKISQFIGKMLYGKDYCLDKIGNFDYQGILNYHKDYFQNPRYILANDDFSIINDSNENKYKYNNNTTEIEKIDSYIYKQGDDEDKIIVTEYKKPFDFFIIYFLFELVGYRIEFQKRTQEFEYNYSLPWSIFLDKHYGFSFPAEYNINISINFFEKYKKHFIDSILYDEGKEFLIYSKLLLNKTIDLTIVEKYIKGLSYDIIIKILK